MLRFNYRIKLVILLVAINTNFEIKDLVEDYLINPNNSYNKDNKDPMYTITLDAEAISAIRSYNDKTVYSDYNMECDADGVICKSKLLKLLKNGSLANISGSKLVSNLVE